MYAYEWDSSTGGYILTPMPLAFSKEPRPVYYKELDILGFDKYWDYDKNDSFPYMWAEVNNYYYRGRLVAKTKGGSLYTPPELVLIEDPEPEGYPLRFVDIPAMVDKNRQLMEQLVQETIKKIYNTFIEYQDKVDVFYVAFSGGKDSVVALDLVQRALPHNCFKVLFGDTGMEFPDTYETVEKIKQICAEEKIEFLQAKSKLKPENTWQIFGPPAVTIRWCCSVHKTTPQIMQLREVLQKPDFTGMAFTGVRGDESLSRSEYDAISYGGKHSGQYSCHPILEWNTAELFLYIYENGLTFNNAYKKGNTRAGCLVCPMSQGKHDYMLEYLKLYDGGKLPAVAEKINDGGQYINQLQYKFSSDAANWVWNTDTVNAKIDELICEYEIIEISNGVLSKNATYMEAIRAWVDKIGQIRLAYSMIKNELGDSKAFYEMLYNLYKQRNLLDSQKKPFLDLLRENIENFKYFMGSQSSLFIKACSFYLDDLSEEDVKSILDDDTYGFGGSYLLERDKYTDKVQKAVDLYKNAQLYTQLKKKWNDLTDTDSPYMWSNKYHMPILAMVPDDEVATARKVFGAINSKTKDENTITTALDYLDKMTYVQKLNNKEDRDKAFRDVFLEEFSELFDDVDEVRTYLQNHISDSPYHWLGNKAVTAKIKTMANAKYNESGYGKAKKVIDEMPAEQVKEYLKKMIEDNFVVGLEIIKKQK